jgi:hypothetical protein
MTVESNSKPASATASVCLEWLAFPKASTAASAADRDYITTVLRFDHEVLMSGRSLQRPINYALSRIVPPRVATDPRKRPVVVVDPRKELLKQINAIVGAGDPPLAAERDRLAHLSQVLAAPIEKAAPLVPSRPASLSGTTARRSAVSR